MPTIGDIEVFPLCLGGNVFGWTCSDEESFEVLDAYVAAGGNFIDTADAYPPVKDGRPPGTSERIIGAWMAARGNRDEIVIATKVGMSPGFRGVDEATVRKAAEGSLERLGVDHIDLYYAHIDYPETPLEETLGVFDALVREGKVREIGASNYDAQRLAEGVAIVEREGLTPYGALQVKYNLVDRGRYEDGLRDVCADAGIGCVPHSSLANGFLTGKYRPGQPADSPRAYRAAAYLEEERGLRVLDELDAISAAHETSQAAVALAWLAAQPTVAAPLASARTTEQLADILTFTGLRLDEEELQRLDEASADRVSS